ncbi:MULTISPECIES: glycosyltransferase family 2 protein [Bordetella]|uniref:LPS biosynthesis protein n=1 Tax=Bordetella genomosp. 6 TaxID=463024 RepID=A0ABX4FH95_9BORD|nr:MULTISPECIES: glycosyltransferase family 2 protein [Bordetella]ARP75984.1 LPS biosynthesis protein [Bordetella genomosp. 6]KCV64928.1 glycosyltransferase, group 2 family protein [Bordetella bronchiseptica 99-R-0433]OZI81489.1 LPS biosynthesis protein [Bordetella genomosp. 6]
MTLSVIIITKNEAANILACLESVAFADEFIVVDSGSTDNTVELARDFGARVEVTPDWPGFGPQKNRALDLATGDWVLSIDADERVTPELAGEIQAAMAGASADCYEIARLSDFCGRFIRHSGWWPDYVLRLFRRGSARFTDAAVHERVVPARGQPARLRGHFLHYPYNNFDALIAKVNRYSSDAAAMMHARGKRATVFSALGHGFWTFVRIYLIRRGFLDGRHGLVLAVTAAAGSFFRYAKLMFLSEPRK